MTRELRSWKKTGTGKFDLNAALAKVLNDLRGKRSVRVSWVPTGLNPADPVSRGAAFSAEVLQHAAELLRLALPGLRAAGGTEAPASFVVRVPG